MAVIDLKRFDGGMGRPAAPQRWPFTWLELLWVASAVAFVAEPMGALGMILIGCFFVHYFFGGAWRGQLYPLYLLTAAVTPGLVFEIALETYRFEVQCAAGTLAALTIVAAVVMPRTTLGEPSGPCRDIVRHSCVVESPTDGVTFMLSAYVPAKIDLRDAVPAPYLRMGLTASTGMATFAKVPAAIMNNIAAVTGPFWEEAWAAIDPRAFAITRPREAPTSSSGARLPVVVFSHGLGGVPDIYSSLIAEMCSQGFVVVAVEHNDGSAAHSQLPPRFRHSRPYEPLNAAEIADPVVSYAIRRDQLHVRVREVLTAVDFVEALATIEADDDTAKQGRRTAHGGGGGGGKTSAKARRREKEAAAASAPSREARKARQGRAPPKAKEDPAAKARRKAAAAMARPQDIKAPGVITIDDDEEPVPGDDSGDDDAKTAGESRAVARQSRGAAELKQRSSHARSVVRLRREAKRRAAGAEASRRHAEGGANGVDRMAAAHKANEDNDIEMMVELLRRSADPSRVVVMGHSFGAATALQAASVRPGAFSAVVALDPWVWPLHRTTMARGVDAGTPVLSLLSPRFAQPWNAAALGALLDPEARAAAARSFDRLDGSDPAARAAMLAGPKPRKHPSPGPDDCNGFDDHSGVALVPIVVPPALSSSSSAPDRCAVVVPGSDHQSFTDVEYVAEPVMRYLAKHVGTAPAAESAGRVARTVSRWLLGRVVGKEPADGPDAPSSDAMAPGPDAPAFSWAGAKAATLAPSSSAGAILRGLRAPGVGGAPWQWGEGVKKARLATAAAPAAAAAAADDEEEAEATS